MLNILWGIMILIGIVYGIASGNGSALADGALNSAKDAVTLCITMLGILSFWTGLMQIATASGLIEKITEKIAPFMHWLFPNIPKEHPAMQYMTTNVIANLLGLGWAATPAGIKSMEQLALLEQEKGSSNSSITQDSSPIDTTFASDEMCTFLILNISSLQLIPINIIAYRSQYGSTNPTAVIGPALLATLISTFAGILFCKWKCRHSRPTHHLQN